MISSDHSIQRSRQHIADLHAQANRQRLARDLPTRPHRRAGALRQLAAAVALAAVPASVLLVETAGRLAR
jgi:hypothetical protein